MSQYQPNYGYPTNYSGYPDPLAIAKRASVLMFILAVLGIIGGVLFAAMAVELKNLVSQPQFRQAFHDSGATMDQMQTSLIFFGVACFVGGLLMAIFGVFVRSGRPGPIIAGIVLNAVALLVCAFVLLSSLVVASHGGGANLASALCMLTIPVLLLIVLMMWLIQALKNSHGLPYAQPNPGPYWQYPPDYHPFPPNAAIPPPPGPIPPPPSFEPPKQPGE